MDWKTRKKGQLELGDRMSIRISDLQGTWLQIDRGISQAKGFALEGLQGGEERVRGRLSWMDAVGNWVEGVFQHTS